MCGGGCGILALSHQGATGMWQISPLLALALLTVIGLIEAVAVAATTYNELNKLNKELKLKLKVMHHKFFFIEKQTLKKLKVN